MNRHLFFALKPAANGAFETIIISCRKVEDKKRRGTFCGCDFRQKPRARVRLIALVSVATFHLRERERDRGERRRERKREREREMGEREGDRERGGSERWRASARD